MYRETVPLVDDFSPPRPKRRPVLEGGGKETPTYLPALATRVDTVSCFIFHELRNCAKRVTVSVADPHLLLCGSGSRNPKNVHADLDPALDPRG